MRKYEQCATRLENRGAHPPTREYVDALVAGLQAGGIEASWHSAVDYQGRPLFPSRIFPVCHPQSSLEAFRYLIDRLHAIGRPVLSWYPLNLGGGVLPAHPEWRMKFYELEGVPPNPEGAAQYACFNSPYGALLPAFAAEVVRAVGFDGLWFDGSTFSNQSTAPMCQPGCACEFCRARFKRDTGLALPAKVDFSSRAFRVWLNWRYDVLMEVWRKCAAAIRAARPDAVVCFNNYRRRNPAPFAWNTAIPLRALDDDIMMSGELDGFPGQADIQIKINRAYRGRRGAETWWPLCDHWNCWTPDVEPLTAVQAVLGCLSAGGVACAGTGVDALTVAPVLREMEQAAAPRMPFVAGETVEYAGILASQQTMDFYATPADSWDGIHGANEFCRHAHLQSSVLFDDYLDRGELARYPVLFLGNAACLSRQQAEQLEQYVRRGGVLVACHEAGTRDELGYPHARPVLDDLLGIRERRPGQGDPTWEISAETLQQACGPFVTFKAPHTLATPAGDAQLLAQTLDRTSASWEGDAGGKAPRFPGLWRRSIGAGAAVYAGVDFFLNYLRWPVPRMMRLWRALLVGIRAPRLTARAPQCVTINTRIQPDGRWAVHLHNAPGSSYAYPNPPGSNYLHAPGEILPVHNVILELREKTVRSARSGLTSAAYDVSAGSRVHVPAVELQEVVLLEVN